MDKWGRINFRPKTYENEEEQIPKEFLKYAHDRFHTVYYSVYDVGNESINDIIDLMVERINYENDIEFIYYSKIPLFVDL